MSTIELLRQHSAIAAELNRLGIARSANICGDYAESLVCAAVGGRLLPRSSKGCDIVAPDGTRIEVKARKLKGRENIGAVQSGTLRQPFAFDKLAFVVFTADWLVQWAALIPASIVNARASTHTYGYRVLRVGSVLEEAGIEPLDLGNVRL